MLKAVVNSPIRSDDQTINNGNLVIGTAGKGIDFSATPGPPLNNAVMTSELLSDYEEGTWTPTLGGDATYTRQQGNYTKVGRMVTLQCDLIVNVLGTGSTTILGGVPYSAGSTFYAGSVSYYADLNGTYTYVTPLILFGGIQFNTTGSAVSTIGDTSPIFKNGARVILSLTYFA